MHDPKNKECPENIVHGLVDDSPCTCPTQKEDWEIAYKRKFHHTGIYPNFKGTSLDDDIQVFIRTQISLAEERGRREEISRHAQTLSALATMWNQYCSKETGHEFMCAGEEASEILSRYHLLKAKEGKIINGMCGNAEVKYPLSAEENENFFLEILTQKS